MKKIFIGILIVALLVLDWAALHDILKGEPNPIAEYLMLSFSVVIYSGLVIRSLIGGETR